MSENSFANAVKRKPAPPPATLDEEPQPEPKKKPGRPKKTEAATAGSSKEISARLDPATARKLKVLAAMHDTSIQALMAEAIAWIFRKYEKSQPATDGDQNVADDTNS